MALAGFGGEKELKKIFEMFINKNIELIMIFLARNST